MPLNISVDLTTKQIEEAITLYLASQGLRVKSTHFNTSLVGGDYFDRGPGKPTLTGAKVEVEPINTGRSYSSLASQIDSVESCRANMNR